jgi:glycerol-1-phosphate dehydrogenase [NAD(P)+]
MNNKALDSLTTEYNIVGADAYSRLPEVCAALFGRRTILVVSDEVIWAHEGERLEAALSGKVSFRLSLLPGTPAPYADDNLVAKIKELIKGEAALSFGAGSINDVVKRASHELGQQYICVPTAPSVDGYASYGAAITVKGFKTTLECPAPRAIVADSGVLARAPAELRASGYGDLVAKIAGGVDWMAADAGGIEPIHPVIWDMVQPCAMEVYGKAREIRSGDPEAIATLYGGLVASGLAMQRYHDSRPASGAEHLLSHVWEMEHLCVNGVPVSHGFKVAIGTIASTIFQRALFSKSAGELAAAAAASGDDVLERRLAAAASLLGGSPVLQPTIEAVRAKTPVGEALKARRATYLAGWDSLREKALARLPEPAVLAARMAEAGCPSTLAEISLDAASLLRGFRIAKLIRKRFTTLDLADEFGVFEELAERAAAWDLH